MICADDKAWHTALRHHNPGMCALPGTVMLSCRSAYPGPALTYGACTVDCEELLDSTVQVPIIRDVRKQEAILVDLQEALKIQNQWTTKQVIELKRRGPVNTPGSIPPQSSSCSL